MNQPRRRHRRPEGVGLLEERLLLAAPVLDPITNASLPALKALIKPLTATDADGDAITYSVVSDNNLVAARVVTNTVALRFDVANFGTMEFLLLPEFAPETVSRIRGLVESNFYNGLTFHRVIPGFVNQGGDPNGDGTGGPGFRFDDEFSPQAIFSGVGQLAMANSGPDTNGSQFFITVAPQRGLDYKHTIFGQLVRGFDVMSAINATPTGANDRPTSPVTITSASIVENDSDAVLVLQSLSAGTSRITVTARDSQNATDVESFDATTITDTVNDPPYLGPVLDVIAARGMPATITLSSVDLEGSPLTFAAEFDPATTNATLEVQDNRVIVTPVGNFQGTLPLIVGVRQSVGETRFDTQRLNITFREQAFNTETFDPIVFVDTPTTVRLAHFTTAVQFPTANFTATFTRQGGQPIPARVVAALESSYDVEIDLDEPAAATIPYTLELRDLTTGTVATEQGVIRATIDILTVQATVDAPAAGTRSVSGRVATLVDVDVNRPASNLAATIDWGDGTTEPGTLVVLGPGLYDITGSHTYAALGSYPFSVTVTATNNDTASASQSVAVPNLPPVLDAIPDQTVTEGTPIDFTAMATDPDAGQTLTFSLGEGAPAGSSIDPVTGAFTLPTGLGSAQLTVTVIVSDDADPAATDSQVVALTVEGVPPTVIAGPVGNIDQGETYSGIGSFSDPGDGPWTATVDYGDGSGSQPLDLLSDKTFSLAHTYTRSGAFTITVTVVDTNSPEAPGTAQVVVNVANIAPIVVVAPAAGANEGSLFTGSGSFIDPGTETWTATVDYGDGSGVQPLTLQPDKTFSLSHVYARLGTYPITVVVTDTGSPALAGTGSTSVAIAGVAPTVSAGPSTTIDMLSTYTGSGIFVDPGSNSWTATVDYGDGSGVQPLTLSNSKTFALSHLYELPGDYTVTVRVTDASLPGSPGVATVPIRVRNVVPIVVPTPFGSVGQFRLATAAGSFGDVGDGPWSATVDYGDGSGVQALPLTDLAGFQLTHRYDTAGNFPVTVRVTDRFGDTGVSTFNVEVVPMPPVTISQAFLSRTRGRVVSTTLLFTGEVDPRSAGNVANYAFVRAGRDRRFGTADDVVVGRFRSARVIRDSVGLTPNGRLALDTSIRLRVSNLLDTRGRALGGTTDGRIFGRITRGGLIDFSA
ncbi:MAG: PKD domain-containing protein [Isosphaeraceae bacterium]|nr:PKD domain-containing protein [Isosphaeraceae bacterium]